MKPRFESMGLYLPEKILSTEELLSGMSYKPEFDFEKLTGIKNRRIRGKDENSFVLAVNAAQDCLKHSIYNAEELDIIIFCSITRFKDKHAHLFEPSISLFIKNAIGAPNAMNFDISNACAGMTTGVYIIYNMIKAGIVKNGMVVSGEAISHVAETAVKEISQPIDDQFASLTVGDSGAACIMDRSFNDTIGIEFIDFATISHYAELCIGKPSIINPGIAMYTNTQGMSSSELINIWPRLFEDILKKNGRVYNPDDYDYVITHQVSVGAIQKYLATGKDYFKQRMPETLMSVVEYGNTSSTTHFVVLYNNLKNGILKKGSRVLLMASASGIQIGFIYFTMDGGELEI